MLRKIKRGALDVAFFALIAVGFSTFKALTLTAKLFKKKKPKIYVCGQCGCEITRGTGVFLSAKKKYYFCTDCVRRGIKLDK